MNKNHILIGILIIIVGSVIGIIFGYYMTNPLLDKENDGSDSSLIDYLEYDTEIFFHSKSYDVDFSLDFARNSDDFISNFRIDDKLYSYGVGSLKTKEKPFEVTFWQLNDISKGIIKDNLVQMNTIDCLNLPTVCFRNELPVVYIIRELAPEKINVNLDRIKLENGKHVIDVKKLDPDLIAILVNATDVMPYNEYNHYIVPRLVLWIPVGLISNVTKVIDIPLTMKFEPSLTDSEKINYIYNYLKSEEESNSDKKIYSYDEIKTIEKEIIEKWLKESKEIFMNELKK